MSATMASGGSFSSGPDGMNASMASGHMGEAHHASGGSASMSTTVTTSGGGISAQ